MVQVQPVVFRKLSIQHLGIPDLVIIHFGIGQGKGDGIVPGKSLLGGVNGNFRCLIQLNYSCIYVRLFHFSNNFSRFTSADYFCLDIFQSTSLQEFLGIVSHKASAPVIKQPFGRISLFQVIKDDTISLEMIGL